MHIISFFFLEGGVGKNPNQLTSLVAQHLYFLKKVSRDFVSVCPNESYQWVFQNSIHGEFENDYKTSQLLPNT